MVKVEFTEDQRHCDECGQETNHRIATVTDGPATGETARCLVCADEG